MNIFFFHSNGIARKIGLPREWIILENQRTVQIFSNNKFLRDIRTVDKQVNVQCNDGTTSTNMVGDMQGFGEVWYNPNGISNILLMNLVEGKPGWETTYSKDGGFKAHKSGRSVRIFVISDRGLFYMDTCKNKIRKHERKE